MLVILTALLFAPKTSWTQKLPDGASVSLVSVSNFDQRYSWAPDGTRQATWMVPELFLTVVGKKKMRVPALANVANFIVQVKPRTSQPSVAFRIGNGRNLSPDFTLWDEKQHTTWWSAAGVDNRKLPPKIDVQVGVGTGKWKATSTHSLQSGQDTGPKFFGSIIREAAKGPNENPTVILEATIPKSVKGTLAYQIKIYGRDGKSLQPAGSGPVKRGGAPRYFFIDNGQRLVKAELQTQPYKWVTFKGVHVRAKELLESAGTSFGRVSSRHL